MKHDKIKSFFLENGADWNLWHNNPPGASHMGGVWECQIQSATLFELFWKDCWRLTVILWMMIHSEHWWLKLSLLFTQDHSVWRPSVTQKVKYHFHQVTSLRRKQVLSCLHQVNLANQMHTQQGDGDVCKILRENFGADLRQEFFQSLQARQIWKKRMWNFAVGNIVIGISGQLMLMQKMMYVASHSELLMGKVVLVRSWNVQ